MSLSIHQHKGRRQMSFVSELRNRLINDKQVYDLSRNAEFAAFNFIGLKETALTVELVGFIRADGLTEKQIVDLCDKFFSITQTISYDFGIIKPGPRNPNALLCFVFEEEVPRFLIDFIQHQRKISHWKRNAVLVSWVIDVKHQQIYTHKNPVSSFPPVFIMESWVFPGLNYLKSFVYAYYSQPIHRDNNIEEILGLFSRLEIRLEKIYQIIQAIPEQQFKSQFPNAEIVTIINIVSTYIEKNKIQELIMGDKGDTYNNTGQVGAMGNNASSDNNTFIQSEQKQTLAQAAAEIQKLLKQLEQRNPTATEPEKVAYVNDETSLSFKRRVAGALQASGETAIDEFILENKYLKVAKAAIKGWLKPGS